MGKRIEVNILTHGGVIAVWHKYVEELKTTAIVVEATYDTKKQVKLTLDLENAKMLARSLKAMAKFIEKCQNCEAIEQNNHA